MSLAAAWDALWNGSRLAAPARAEPSLRGTHSTLSGLERPNSTIHDIFSGGITDAGIAVTEDRALGLSTAYACIRVLAETMGVLPLHVYRRTDAGRDRAPEHYTYPLLHDAPNDYQTATSFIQTLIAHAVGWGNAYGVLDWSAGGRLRAILPVEPWLVEAERRNGRLLYRFHLQNGTETLPAEDVLHIHGISFDGITGVSPIGQVRATFGEGLAQSRFAGAFFKNLAQPGLIVSAKNLLSDTKLKNWRDSLDRFRSGGAFGTLIFDDEAKVQHLSMAPADAQFLEGRKFTREEVCAIYGVPPHMVGALDRATFSNIEHQSIQFAKHTILPWCKRIEQELKRKLFGLGSTLFCEFDLDGLERGDLASRTQAFSVGINNSILTVNEVRARMNLPPVPGGEVARMPVNTAAMGADGAPVLAQPAEPEPPADPPAAPPAEPDEDTDEADRALFARIARASAARAESAQRLFALAEERLRVGP